MQYEYFYGAQAEQFSFYRIPKALFTEPNFRELSTDAKVLYGILLDRMSLSLKNQWLDAVHLKPNCCVACFNCVRFTPSLPMCTTCPTSTISTSNP